MISINEALEIIYKNSTPVGTEIIPIEKSSGRVIAETVSAKYPLPRFDNSAMDGFGVSIIDVGKKVKISKIIFAGDEVSKDFILEPDSCVKIMTGATIPKGVGAVIPIEDVEVDGDFVTLPNSIKPSSHIRKKGEDIEIGEKLIEKGEKIESYQIGLLASQGISHIEVFRKPKVTVFATGKELKMYYEKVEPHQIFNTNSPTLLAKSESLGAEVSFVKIASDKKEEIIKAIQNSLSSDLIITSGGISVGDADFTKESFETLGMETLFQKVEIKPGKPTTFGKIGEKLVLNLPGNPSAGLINFEIFGKAIIQTLSGASKKFLDVIECEILENLKVKKGKTTVVLGFFDGSTFKPLKKQNPAMINPLAKSNGFIILDREHSEVQSGDYVRFLPTSFSWFSDFQKNIIT